MPSPAPTNDLIPLLARLLQSSDPALAESLRRRGGQPAARVLAELEQADRVRRVRAQSARHLAGTAPRALCLRAAGGVLLESAGEDAWRLEDTRTGEARVVNAAAVDRLFPCEAWVPVTGAERAAGAPAGPAAGSAAVAVYLRLVAQLLGLCLPIAMMLIIDKVVTQGGRDTLVALLAGVALLTVFQYLFLAVHTLHALRESEVRALPRRRQVLAALLGCSGASRLSAEGWEVVQAAAEGGRFACETRPQAVADGLYVVLLAMLMASFSPRLLAVSAAFVPFYLVVETWSSRRAERHAAACAGLRSRLSTRFFESVAGAGLIHNMNLGGHVLGYWTREDQDLAAARYRMTLCRRLCAVAVEFLQRLSLIVIMLLGVSSVIGGLMTLGQYIAFNLLSMQLTQPVLRLAAFRRARADDRLVAAAGARLEEGCRAAAWPEAQARIAPRGGPLVLEARGLVLGEGQTRRHSFVLREGFWLGIVGASGCGKTTLLRAVAGLHRPVEGAILLNGVPLLAVEAEERARAVCLVPQDPVIFSGSLAENIRLGDPAAPPQRILLAAYVCGLGPLLERLPSHLDTVVGAAGRELSGGERQRVAIARAVLRRPQVLLLDEATAALDGDSEAAVLASLRRHLPECAVVVVSHRPSSLAACRDLVRLDAPADGGNPRTDAAAPVRVV